MKGRSTPERINLLYDDVEQHNHVIVNITGAMAKRMYVMYVANQARVMPPTSVSRRVATAWRALRVFSLPSEYLAQSLIDISGAKYVLRTINIVPRIRNLFPSARDVARLVERY